MGKYEAEKNLKKLVTCEAWNKRSCLKQGGRKILKPEVAIWPSHMCCVVYVPSPHAHTSWRWHIEGFFLSQWPLFNNEQSVFKLWNTTSRIYVANDMPVSWVNLKVHVLKGSSMWDSSDYVTSGLLSSC